MRIRGTPNKVSSFRRWTPWTGPDKPAGTCLPQRQVLRSPHDYPIHPDHPAIIGPYVVWCTRNQVLGRSSEHYSSLRQVNFGVPKGSGSRLLCLLRKTSGQQTCYHGRIWQRSSLTCSNLSGWGKCFSATLALMQMIPRWVPSLTRASAKSVHLEWIGRKMMPLVIPTL